MQMQMTLKGNDKKQCVHCLAGFVLEVRAWRIGPKQICHQLCSNGSLAYCTLPAVMINATNDEVLLHMGPHISLQLQLTALWPAVQLVNAAATGRCWRLLKDAAASRPLTTVTKACRDCNATMGTLQWVQ